MAKIVLKRGSIYFLKEKDYLTGEIPGLLKLDWYELIKKQNQEFQSIKRVIQDIYI